MQLKSRVVEVNVCIPFVSPPPPPPHPPWPSSPQNVVMLMSDVVDWLIPDIPKDISMQIHKEKILMVELFMREEHGKMQRMGSTASTGAKQKGSSNSYPPVPVARQRSMPPAHCYKPNNV